MMYNISQCNVWSNYIIINLEVLLYITDVRGSHCLVIMSQKTGIN